MREDIAFDANGTTLRGWLYLPERASNRCPAVVLAHGFSALKEMGLDDYAAVFTAAGLACLVYDQRNFGASDGAPRYDIDPIAQMRDYRHAITYAESRREIDPARIGLWGTSYSGGLVLMATALDRRVRCVVSQVPFISGFESFRRLIPLDRQTAYFSRLEAERRAIAAGAVPSVVEICADDPAQPADSPGRLTYRYFNSFRESKRVEWDNKVTLRSLDYRLEFDARPFMSRISPTPLLMLVATRDTITPTEVALEAYAQAHAPKALELLEGDHYQPYQAGFAASSAVARDWFVTHLIGKMGHR
ncbi:MAG: alpha/beta fold hydrolase [Gammaproteobacteria bacterium]|nr:alpha/beta fold hydrolase [Gammaproteobacteria bacterium]